MGRIIGITIIVLMLVSGIIMAGFGCSENETPAPVSTEAGPAPDFQLPDLNGQPVSLSSLRGKPVMLNFWATWCGPCRGEMPHIQAVYEGGEWTEQGLVILAVNLGESSSKVTEFMEDNNLSFTVLLDEDQDVAKSYNIRAIPTTFFIDENGIIKDTKIGAFSSKEDIDWRLVNSILEGD